MGAYRLTRAALGEVGPDQWPPGSHDPPSGSNYWNLESTQYFILVHDREARGLICRHGRLRFVFCQTSSILVVDLAHRFSPVLDLPTTKLKAIISCKALSASRKASSIPTPEKLWHRLAAKASADVGVAR
jgi:hypothetical protein